MTDDVSPHERLPPAPIDRRATIAIFGIFALCRPGPADAEAAPARFILEAFRMRDLAVAAGDQPYGAVVVLNGQIVGAGASRVVSDRNPDAHAERVALWAAQTAVGRANLADAVIYSSSIPCAACQRALAAARVAKMFHGRDGVAAGPPHG